MSEEKRKSSERRSIADRRTQQEGRNKRAHPTFSTDVAAKTGDQGRTGDMPRIRPGKAYIRSLFSAGKLACLLLRINFRLCFSASQTQIA